MHEHMDEMGVINMNGRVYDPLIGRFLSADPHIQSPSNLQSFNRYAYVQNNPLAYTDPSGYFFKKLFRAVVAIAVAVFIVVVAMPAIFTAVAGTAASGAALAATTGAKILTGAVAGGFSSAISAGSGKAFWQGALSGALFAWAGAATAGDNVGQLTKLSAHAGAGCVSAAAAGGNCGRGAASAIVGKFVTLNADVGGNDFQGHLARGAAATVSGGLASVAGGGKFSDGAQTAAFGYMFNAVITAGVQGRIPFIGGGSIKGAISFPFNGDGAKFDIGVIAEGDVVPSAGKMLGGVSKEYGWQAGDFDSIRGGNDVQYAVGVGPGGGTVSFDAKSNEFSGASLTVGPVLGASVSGSRSNTISLRQAYREIISPVVNYVKDRLSK
jgi:RHS repeat-associated protein